MPDNDPVSQANLVIARAEAADSLKQMADLLDRMAVDAQRFLDQYEGDPVSAYSRFTVEVFDQAGHNPRFLAGLAAAAACKLAGMDLRS